MLICTDTVGRGILKVSFPLGGISAGTDEERGVRATFFDKRLD